MWDFDASTGNGTDYIYLAGRLVANQRPATAGGISYYYNDLQGSVIATTDAVGTFRTSVDYRPYGQQVLGATETGPGYTGHVNDPDLGLVYMQARYYDPAVGRFLSTDPAGSSPGNFYSFNQYEYANNSPIVNIDADGRQSVQTQVADFSHFGGSLDPRQDPLLSTTGKAIAADVAFVVGAAINNRPLQTTAVDGMREATSGGRGAAAAIALITMGMAKESSTWPACTWSPPSRELARH